jgi:hypothetical protein
MSLLNEFIGAYGIRCMGFPCVGNSRKCPHRTCNCLCKPFPMHCLCLPVMIVGCSILCPCLFAFRELKIVNGIIRLKYCCLEDYGEETVCRPYRDVPLDADDFCRCCCFIGYNYDVVLPAGAASSTSHGILFCRTKKLDELVCALKAEREAVEESRRSARAREAELA